MNAPLQNPETLANPAWEKDETIVLSVLVPFYKDNPQNLLDALAKAPPKGVEIVLYDDGSANFILSQNMRRAVLDTPLPAALISAQVNRGRSAARNALIEAARGQWVLFLDADMMPQDNTFLSRWINCIEQRNPAIMFGGFSVPALAEVEPALTLHQAFSQISDCLPAKLRAQNPAKHVCTSNLLVRRDVLRECPFDDGFAGWGWEDVEWAARAAKTHTIEHIDNPACHFGLESADTLVRRFRESAPNYARFVERHPELARSLPSWKAARLFQNIPGASLFRPLFAAMACDKTGLVPLRLRIVALKLWRSSWYAEALT